MVLRKQENALKKKKREEEKKEKEKQSGLAMLCLRNRSTSWKVSQNRCEKPPQHELKVKS